MQDEKRQERVRDIFDRFDADSSGWIDEEELANAFAGMGIETSSDQLHGLFKEADINKDQQINFEEFYKVIGALMAKQEISILESQLEERDAEMAAK